MTEHFFLGIFTKFLTWLENKKYRDVGLQVKLRILDDDW
jgi:hypothetical protein